MVNQRNAISRQCVEAFSNGSSSCLKGKVDPTLIEDIPETHIEVWNGQWPRNTPYIYIPGITKQQIAHITRDRSEAHGRWNGANQKPAAGRIGYAGAQVRAEVIVHPRAPKRLAFISL